MVYFINSNYFQSYLFFLFEFPVIRVYFQVEIFFVEWNVMKVWFDW